MFDQLVPGWHRRQPHERIALPVRWSSSSFSARCRTVMPPLLTMVAVLLTLFGCGAKKEAPISSVASSGLPKTTEPQVRAFCGDCHQFPRPDSFPKERWYEEVRRGYDFYYKSGRTDLKPPVQQEVVDYFRERAPTRLGSFREESRPLRQSPLRFEMHPLVIRGQGAEEVPAISFLDGLRSPDEPGQLRISDMRSGSVLFSSFSGASVRPLVHPCRHPTAVRDCDLNGNGIADLVICDLGSFLPEDHDRGRLIWLPDGTRDNQAVPQTLLQNVGRVADVRVVDFDNDGDEDLVVAEFGWHRTGGIHLLWNERSAAGVQTFRGELIDRRSGTIHVPTADLDGDGRCDFVAVISQEHETVVAFLNRSHGFEKTVIYAAPDPSYGSSGIELTDLDRDGDIDVLYTNGDTFDSFVLKPYHGLLWLENKGQFPFMAHLLTTMPGIHRALPADLDGDGDLDIVASAMVPHSLLSAQSDAGGLDALIWLEHTDDGQFHRHAIPATAPVYVAMTVTDLDNDQDLDIIVGCFYEAAQTSMPQAISFFNLGRFQPP